MCVWTLLSHLPKIIEFYLHIQMLQSKNVSWPHFSWPILYSIRLGQSCAELLLWQQRYMPFDIAVSFGVGFLSRVYWPGEWVWFDSNGKNGNQTSVEGSFGNEFPSICKHCGDMTAWSRKTWKICFFAKNDPLLEDFQNSVPKVFIATPIDVLCSNFVNFGRREIGKIVRCLPDKKKQNFAWLSRCRYSAPDFIQISSLSAELYPNAWTPSERARKWIRYPAEA